MIVKIEGIETRWRPLSEAEQIVAQTLIKDVEAWALFAVPSLQDRLTADVDGNFTRNVERVLAGAVIRVLKNPEAYRQEQDGSYSYTLDRAVRSGELDLTVRDLRALLGLGRSASISLVDSALRLIGGAPAVDGPESWVGSWHA